jgi:hypothetical protein
MTKSKLKLTALFAVFALLGAWSVGSSKGDQLARGDKHFA